MRGTRRLDANEALTMSTALDRPCPVCDARVAEWCIDGDNFGHIHLARAYPPPLT